MQKEEQIRWRRFGNELRRLREQAGMTQRQLAGKIGLSHGMVGGIERATRKPQSDQADICDTVLDTGGTLRRIWQELNNQRYVPEWFKDVLLLEQRATEVREYEPTTIPGLLQTAAYARTLIRARRPTATAEEVEETVKSRTGRLSAVLENEKRPLLWFIVHEAVLSRTVGDETIMRKQLDYIAGLVEDGTIRLQVLPATPTSADPGAPFRLMTLTDTQSAAYVEHVLGGEIFERPDKVNELTTLFGALQAEALPVLASIELIRKINGERYGDVG
ncbi:helix-turn-helix domain-containing protein [Salinactinospora qingdaonensis]|uniref:Helix-turn-helix transcriptional regulator n=1 Tax=Salinactinospora qingdaonensis TaxID=702744 RepID=A0ABP7FDB7_9ACTN